MIIATLIEGPPPPPLKHQFVGVFTAMFAKHLNARIGTVFFFQYDDAVSRNFPNFYPREKKSQGIQEFPRGFLEYRIEGR